MGLTRRRPVGKTVATPRIGGRAVTRGQRGMPLAGPPAPLASKSRDVLQVRTSPDGAPARDAGSERRPTGDETMRTQLIRDTGGMPAFMAALVIMVTTTLWFGIAATAPPPPGRGTTSAGWCGVGTAPRRGSGVIAETDDFDTRFRKIVVTDDDGRYVLPDLPDAGYEIWVRGYGLRDSEPVSGRAGHAARPRRGARREPARGGGRSIPPTTGTRWWRCRPRTSSPAPATPATASRRACGHQAAWIDGLKQGCQLCHQLGERGDPGDPEPRRLRLDGGGVGPTGCGPASAAP